MTYKKVLMVVGMALGVLFLFTAISHAVTTVYAPVPRYDSSLALSLSATQTSSMSMVSGVDGNGETLTGPMCFTLDTGNAGLVEDACGVASGTTVTNLVRGVDSSGFNASSTLAHPHRVGADVRTTDSPYLMQYYNLLAGNDGFPAPLSYDPSVSNSSIGASGNNLVNVNLLNATAVAGGPVATTSTPGIVTIATATELNNNTPTTVTSSTYTNVVPVALYGKLYGGTPTIPVIGYGSATGTASTTYTFNYTGTQGIFTLPQFGVTQGNGHTPSSTVSMVVTVYGSNGGAVGALSGGVGASITATIPTSSVPLGTTLYYSVSSPGLAPSGSVCAPVQN